MKRSTLAADSRSGKRWRPFSRLLLTFIITGVAFDERHLSRITVLGPLIIALPFSSICGCH